MNINFGMNTKLVRNWGRIIIIFCLKIVKKFKNLEWWTNDIILIELRRKKYRLGKCYYIIIVIKKGYKFSEEFTNFTKK